MSVPYAVACECGRVTPITERQMGFKIACGCTLVVVVPLKVEFDRRPLLKTAGTVVQRIERLQRDGELFGRACGGCGTEDGTRVVTVSVDCERSRVHESGGAGVIPLPVPGFGLLFLWWSEPVRRVRHGRDLELDVPFRLCEPCRETLEPPAAAPVYLGVIAAVVLLSGAVGAAFGWPFALLGLLLLVAALGYARAVLAAKHQQKCKAMLGRVPAYQHLLWQFRAARVEFPPLHDDRR